MYFFLVSPFFVLQAVISAFKRCRHFILTVGTQLDATSHAPPGPLESIALRIKTLKLGFISDFLSKAIEPPTKESIDHVVAVLRGLTALDTTSAGAGSGEGASLTAGKKAPRVEELTPLGMLLAQLPVDPRIGKMMLYVR